MKKQREVTAILTIIGADALTKGQLLALAEWVRLQGEEIQSAAVWGTALPHKQRLEYGKRYK